MCLGPGNLGETLDAQLAAGESWERIATWAAHYCQDVNLHLAPWQVSPCSLHPGYRQGEEAYQHLGGDAAFALKQRAERCGVSKWHPDIVAACERAEAEQRQAAKLSISPAREIGKPTGVQTMIS